LLNQSSIYVLWNPLVVGDHIQERRANGIMCVQITMRQDHDGRQAARVFALLAVGASMMATAALDHMSSALASNPCATSPGRQTEPGTHWYYQTDPVDHRQCWYLERLPTASVTPRNTGSTISTPISSRLQRTPAGQERTAGKGTDALERRPARSKSVESRQTSQTVYRPVSAITAHQINPAADIPLDPARREALFREFLEWQQRQSVETVFRDFLRPQEHDTQAR
jgi:hypothetical protein